MQCAAAKLTVLDVGQGLALVIQVIGRPIDSWFHWPTQAAVSSKVLVYDAGPRFSASFDAGSAIVAPFLRQQGIYRVDKLVVSHGDLDHAGGVSGLKESMPVTDLISSDAKLQTIATQACESGQSWQWQTLRFDILNSLSGRAVTGNNSSCVLRISTNRISVLLTGDIEREAEQALLARYGGTLKSDILVVPHHGSKTSSSEAFVRAVRPRFAVVSAGYKHRFGHPHEQVVARYTAIGSQVINTAATGAISFELPLGDGRQDPRCSSVAPITPSLYRKASGNYWLSW